MADLDLSDGGKHVRTRDGKCVRIYATDHVGSYPIVGWIEGRAGISTWTKDGCYYHKHTNDTYDLVPCSPTETWLIDVPAGQTPICFAEQHRVPAAGDWIQLKDGYVIQACGDWSECASVLTPVTPRRAK
jgi:nitrate reductase alpha subunit